MTDVQYMRLALKLASRAYGRTSPNPMVGAVLVKNGKIIGRGGHRQAGLPHAEIEALNDARKHGREVRGATMFVTLEPCCTHGRTPPCTGAILAAGIRRVVAGATDPNPKHSGHGFEILRRAGIAVERFDHAPGSSRETSARLEIAAGCVRLNEAFNHWIVERTPFVTVKAAMTLDGKIATASGESKWITGPNARAQGMKLRRGNDAILVGINTVLADDPSLTARDPAGRANAAGKQLRRIILDSMARTPLHAKVVSDAQRHLTTVVVGQRAPKRRVSALAKKVNVMIAPMTKATSKAGGSEAKIDLCWLLKQLGEQNVVSLLVEGGGEVNASFLLDGLAQRVAFFYAPKILGGRNARKAVAGGGLESLGAVLELTEVEWSRPRPDLFLTARLKAWKG